MIKTPNQGFLFFFFGVGDEQVGQVGVGGGVRAIILESVTMFYPYTNCYKFSSGYIKKTSTLNQKNCVRGAEGKPVKLWILVG